MRAEHGKRLIPPITTPPFLPPSLARSQSCMQKRRTGTRAVHEQVPEWKRVTIAGVQLTDASGTQHKTETHVEKETKKKKES